MLGIVDGPQPRAWRRASTGPDAGDGGRSPREPAPARVRHARARPVCRWSMLRCARQPGARRKVRRRIDSAGRPGGLVTIERYARRKGAFLSRRWRRRAVSAGDRKLSWARWPPPPSGTWRFDAWLHGAAGAGRARSSATCPTSWTCSRCASAPGIAFRPAMGRVAEAIGGPRARGDAARPAPDRAGRAAAGGLRGAARAQHLATASAPSSPPSCRPRSWACRSPTRSSTWRRDMRRDAVQRAGAGPEGRPARVAGRHVASSCRRRSSSSLGSLLINVDLSRA